jgi:tetrapyrrole methylase family protein / MazG family protein
MTNTGKLMEDLVGIMAALRSPNGCPWDKEQTRESIKPYLIEEVYEVINAIDNKEVSEIKEELGDVLFQVIFHARISEERNEFTIDNVMEGIKKKITERHPHVFGTTKVKDSAEVLINWENHKKKENPDRKSVLDGVPYNMPALLRAHRLQDKASRVGFDWKDTKGVLAKVKEELSEIEECLENKDIESAQQELGDLLFILSNLGRFLGCNSEDVLNLTNNKFIRRFHYIEEKLKESGKKMENTTLAEMDEIWEEAKDKV